MRHSSVRWKKRIERTRVAVKTGGWFASHFSHPMRINVLRGDGVIRASCEFSEITHD